MLSRKFKAIALALLIPVVGVTAGSVMSGMLDFTPPILGVDKSQSVSTLESLIAQEQKEVEAMDKVASKLSSKLITDFEYASDTLSAAPEFVPMAESATFVALLPSSPLMAARTPKASAFQMPEGGYNAIAKDNSYNGNLYCCPMQIVDTEGVVTISNVYGWGAMDGYSAPTMTIDYAAGTVSIPSQKVVDHNSYGEIWMCPIIITSDGKFQYNTQPITGTIDDNGNIELGTWGLLVPEGERKGTLFNVFTTSEWKKSNATYTSVNYQNGADVVSYGLIEQVGPAEIAFYNMGGNNAGDVLYATIYSNKTAKISPQKVFTNAMLGDFFCYPAEITQEGKVRINTGAPIGVSTASEGTGMTIGPWTVTCRAAPTQYIAFVFSSTAIATDFVPEWPAVINADFDGEGTEAKPYIIKTADDLAALSQAVGRGDEVYSQAFYELGADIDMASLTHPFGPIGDDMNAFAGQFDGKGHSIKNLTLSGRGFPLTALFGNVDMGSRIGNMNLVDVNITSGGLYTAGLVAYNAGDIDNVTVSGSIVSKGEIAGGIAAQSLGNVSNSKVTASISSYGNVGGIVGYNFGCISKCATDAVLDIKGYLDASYHAIGGITGTTMQAAAVGIKPVISDCYVAGHISDSRGMGIVGGISGMIANGAELVRCFNVAAISAQRLATSEGDNATGGIAGWTREGAITNCYNAGTIVKSGTSEYVGGIVGYQNVGYVTSSGKPTEMRYMTMVSKCYNSGQIVSTSTDGDKGVVGDSYYYLDFDPIEACFSECYTDTQVNGLPAERFGISTSDLTSGNLPQGFDASVWEAANGYYPTLKGVNDSDAARLSSAVMALTDGEDVSKVKKAFNLKGAEGVVWKLYDGEAQAFVDETASLKIDGNTVNIKDKYDTGILAARQGDVNFKLYRVAVVPKLFDGDGTEQSPYLISTVDDFKTLNTAVGTYGQPHTGDYFKMTNDIDFDLTADFSGVGAGVSPSYGFGGVFDGAGHSIKKLKIAAVAYDADGKAVATGSYQYAGLFNSLNSTAVVKNIVVADDCDFMFWSYSAPIAGYSAGRIENCVNHASVKGVSQYMAGIVGYSNEGVVTGCYNDGDIVAGGSYAGGIAGAATGLIELSQNDGNVSAKFVNAFIDNNNQNTVGGIVGASSGMIDRCINNGNVEAYYQVGGIVGYASGTSITNTVSTGMVKSINDNPARGAFIGKLLSSGTISNNYYDSSVILYDAANSASLPGITGVSTSALVSGTLLDGLDANDWTFTKNMYPSLASVAEQASGKAMRSIYIAFGDKESLANILKDTPLSPNADIVWTLADKEEPAEGEEVKVYFSLADGMLHVVAPEGAMVARDVLTAKIGDKFAKVFDLQAVPVLFEGEGTEQNPYQIASVADMNKLADFMFSSGFDYAGSYFKVMNDIDYAGGELNPIAKGGSVQFQGVFDGNGKTIKGYTYENTVITNTAAKPHPMGYAGRYLGLFGKIGALGRVANLTVEGKMTTYSHVGGIVGDLYGTVENCLSKVALTTTSSGYVGGVASRVFEGGLVKNCEFEGEAVSKSTYAGGIVAQLNVGGTIDGCVNKGSIAGTISHAGIVPDCKGTVVNCVNKSSDFVVTGSTGGIAYAMGTKATIENCHNEGNISPADPTKHSNIAGIVVQSTAKGDALIKDCSNIGNITGKNNVSGIIATANTGLEISGCFNEGQIKAANGTNAAGVVAKSNTSSEEFPIVVHDSYNAGKIVGSGNYSAGFMGEVGTMNHVYDCYNSGEVSVMETSGTSLLAIGGFSGVVRGTVERCYNLGDVSSIGHGTGGFTGLIQSGTVDQCFNLGDVTSTAEKPATKQSGVAGGCVGYTVTKADVSNFYNMGTISAPLNISGIIARANGANTLTNVYNGGNVMVNPDLDDAVSSNLYVRNGSATVDFENLYYDNVRNPNTYVYDPANRGLSTTELMSAELGDKFIYQRATLPMLQAFADNYPAAVAAAYVEFTKDGDSVDNVNGKFYVGMPIDDLVWTSSDNIQFVDSEPGLAVPVETGDAWVKVASPDNKWEKTINLVVKTKTSSIDDSIADAKDVISVTYYDLQGRQVVNPADGGIYVVRTVYADGTVSVEKTVVK